MKINTAKFFLIIFFFFFLSLGFSFERIKELPSETFCCLTMDREGNIYTASKNSVYKRNPFSFWEKVVSIPWGSAINYLLIKDKVLYIVSNRGVYVFKNNNLLQIFKSTSDSVCTSFLINGNIMYVSTTKGIFFKNLFSKSWHKVKLPQEIYVNWMVSLNKNIILATQRGVFVLTNKNFKRTFLSRGKDPQDSPEEEGGFYTPLVLKKDIVNKEKIFLGSNSGLFVSKDRAQTWRRLYIKNLGNLTIKDIAQLSENILFLATNKGLFKVDIERKKAKVLSKNLFASCINSILLNKEFLYLATCKGVFFKDLSKSQLSLLDDFKFLGNSVYLLAPEPDIREVQERALNWNEVHPDKIKNWRKALKKRAFYPTVSIKLGGDAENTYEIYTSSSKSYYVLGPTQRQVNWSINFSWDFGDLVWNSYEDQVDSRSRLTTQLRLDILDEINRVYFERKSLKTELMEASPNKREFKEKFLRLEELTAILDGLTGGFFSQKLRENFKKCRE